MRKTETLAGCFRGRFRRSSCLIAGLSWLCVAAQGQEAQVPVPGQPSSALAVSPSPPFPAEAPPASRTCLLPANTLVELELLDAVSSKTSKPDDLFSLRVAAPVTIGDSVVIPAGAKAVGQVVHAEKARMGGKAGELILAARYLELPQGRIKLRSTFGAAGKDNTGGSIAVALIVSPLLCLAVQGGERELPAGTHLVARIAVATPLEVSP